MMGHCRREGTSARSVFRVHDIPPAAYISQDHVATLAEFQCGDVRSVGLWDEAVYTPPLFCPSVVGVDGFCSIPNRKVEDIGRRLNYASTPDIKGPGCNTGCKWAE
jgi:hypothetical protein